MTETPKKASNIRQAVDFGALVAFMAAYAINRFARGLDGQAALVQARPAFCITHAPGAMLITDLLNNQLASF